MFDGGWNGVVDGGWRVCGGWRRVFTNCFLLLKAASVLLVKLKKHWVGVVASEILA